MTDVPKSLRFWFVVHFVADICFAIPLLIAPIWFLRLLGWSTVDPISTRIVAAALFGIGTESLLGRNNASESFKGMLNLKIIWSSAALAGFLLSIFQGFHPWGLFFFVGIFAAFNILWAYWRIRLKEST